MERGVIGKAGLHRPVTRFMDGMLTRVGERPGVSFAWSGGPTFRLISEYGIHEALRLCMFPRAISITQRAISRVIVLTP